MMIDHFGLLAPFYDSLFTRKTDAFLLELANLPEKGCILDAGGGTGRITQSLVKEGRQIIIADSSFAMLRQAVKKRLSAIHAYTECLPFDDEVFDRILVVDVLHHVYNQKQTAGELWRVLRPGGRVVILEPDIEHPAVWALALFEKLALMRSHFLRLPQVLALFPAVGANKSGRTYRYNFGVVIEKVR